MTRAVEEKNYDVEVWDWEMHNKKSRILVTIFSVKLHEHLFFSADFLPSQFEARINNSPWHFDW